MTIVQDDYNGSNNYAEITVKSVRKTSAVWLFLRRLEFEPMTDHLVHSNKCQNSHNFCSFSNYCSKKYPNRTHRNMYGPIVICKSVCKLKSEVCCSLSLKCKALEEDQRTSNNDVRNRIKANWRLRPPEKTFHPTKFYDWSIHGRFGNGLSEMVP